MRHNKYKVIYKETSRGRDMFIRCECGWSRQAFRGSDLLEFHHGHRLDIIEDLLEFVQELKDD